MLPARIVAEREAQFFETDDGERVHFDLQPYIADHHITVIEASVAEVKLLRDQFDPVYLSRLDDGESESLAHLVRSPAECRTCPADAIVFRTLGLLGRADQGLSLEEILGSFGPGRSVPSQFSRPFRERWTKAGGRDRTEDRGLRRPLEG